MDEFKILYTEEQDNKIYTVTWSGEPVGIIHLDEAIMCRSKDNPLGHPIIATSTILSIQATDEFNDEGVWNKKRFDDLTDYCQRVIDASEWVIKPERTL